MPYRNTFARVFTLQTDIAVAVFVVVMLLLTVGIVRGRRAAKAGRTPRHKPERHLLEGTYVVLLFGMAIFLIQNSISANNHERDQSGRAAVRVVVTGYQWCWRFAYPQERMSVEATCTDGHNLPTLVLPTHRSVEIEVTSSDVVHEFWVPYFDYKVEAFPDHVNTFRITLDHSGRWVGRCAEFCGLFHTYMDFWVRAVSPANYRHWVGLHHGSVVSE